ncbi:MAG: DUF3592 domain-containing protein [Anaerolineae bacterium]|jgi:hypothetical protein
MELLRSRIREISGISWVAYALVLFGLVGVGVNGFRAVQGLMSRTWPTTGGVITQSQISMTTDSDGDTHFTVEVAYEYRVGGVTYVGDRVSYGGVFLNFDDYSAAEQALSAYPQGRQVVVHHNPRNPQRAVLSTDAQAVSLQGLLGFGAFVALGLLMMFGVQRGAL